MIPTSHAVRSVSISVAPSKVYTYPTRLADSYTPAVLEINIQGYQVARAELEISVAQGSTGLKSPMMKRGLRSQIKTLRQKLTHPIEVDNGYIFDCRYEPDDYNIAHVLNDLVTPILAARKLFPTITAVLRAKASPMAQEIFCLLGVPIICTDASVVGKVICVSQAGRDWFAGQGLYASFFDDVTFSGYRAATPERVFISRRKTRRLRNEDEVEGVLQEFGFQKFYFEDIPISEQWSLARNATSIVCVHGAALSSVLFNRKSVNVVELNHPGFVTTWGRNITSAVGGAWRGVRGRLPPDIINVLDYRQDSRHYAFDDTEIHESSLRMALASLDIQACR